MPNPNYRDTVTIFNCDKKAKDEWYKTVVPACYFSCTTIQTASGQSLNMASSYSARFPQSANYLPYKEWTQLVDKTGYFTLSEGDIVVKGLCSKEITGKSPNTANELLREMKPDAFRIRVVKDNTGSKYGKHYRVSGV